MSNRRTTYRLVQGFRAGLDEPPMRQRLSGDAEWHLYDDHAVHLASFKGDSSDAIKGAMREVVDRGDFGTGDWFLSITANTSSDSTTRRRVGHVPAQRDGGGHRCRLSTPLSRGRRLALPWVCSAR